VLQQSASITVKNKENGSNTVKRQRKCLQNCREKESASRTAEKTKVPSELLKTWKHALRTVENKERASKTVESQVKRAL
jgi:hypothetical protein